MVVVERGSAQFCQIVGRFWSLKLREIDAYTCYSWCTSRSWYLAHGTPCWQSGLNSVTRPVTSLGHQGGEEFSERCPNFLNYVQYFQTMSKTFFQWGEKFSRGSWPPPWLRAWVLPSRSRSKPKFAKQDKCRIKNTSSLAYMSDGSRSCFCLECVIFHIGWFSFAIVSSFSKILRF